jgi:uncharacterized surface protein with fasciclin (FAS1) repeats
MKKLIIAAFALAAIAIAPNTYAQTKMVGRLSAADLWAKVKAGNGKAELKTVEGGSLWVMAKGSKLYLVDEKGGKSWITISDVFQSNGVIHVVNTVLMPN